MGTFLKLVGIIEMLGAVALVVFLSKQYTQSGSCKGIGDILARIRCEQIAKNLANDIASAQTTINIYIIVAGAAGALIFFALGHIVTMVEEIHKRTCEKQVKE